MNALPVASVVAITGTVEVGRELTGSYTYNDAENDLEGTSSYRWLRGVVAIPGATALTYTLVAADETGLISFEVTPVALTGNTPGLAVASAPVGPVVANSVQVLTLVYSTTGGRLGDKHLEVTVTLVDGTGDPVAGATVSATIIGPKAGGGTGTTNSLGEVTFRITNAPSGTYTTTVTNVTATGLIWDGKTPSSNSFDK